MRIWVWRPHRGPALFSVGVCLALSLLAALPEPSAGLLRVAVPGPLQAAAAAVVPAFTAAYPEAQVHLVGVADERTATDLLRAGRADAALLRGAPEPGAATGKQAGRSSGRLTFAQVGWEAVAVVTSPFAPPVELTLDQVLDLLSGGRPLWQTLASGATGRAEVLWTSDASVRDLLRSVARSRGRSVSFGKTQHSLVALRRALLRRPTAIGFLPAGEVTPEVRVIPVAGATPAGAGLSRGLYPLARPLYLAYPAAKARTGVAALLREARQRLAAPADGVAVALAGDFLAIGPVAEGIKQHGAAWPLKDVAKLTRDAGLAICNLEAPLSTHGWKIGDYLGDPGAVAALREAGIDAVTLANDHILDGDDPALLATVSLLDREGIAHAGAGSTLERARQPANLTASGLKVALLAYGRPELGRTSTGRRWEASPWSPGIAPVEVAAVTDDVRKARAAGQVVMVAFHWGGEGEAEPRPDDRDLARAAIEAGATVVFGQHPAVAQGLEVYRGGLILYGLGYLAREEPGSPGRMGVVATVTLTPRGARQLELTPVTGRNGRVVPLTGAEQAKALQALHQRSMALDLPAAPLPAPAPAPVPPGPAPGQESGPPASNT